MSGVGKNSASLGLTVSKRTLEYLKELARRGSTLGRSHTAVATFLLERELDKLIEQEPDPKRWRQGL
jgi:hypothetical protein